MRNHIDLPTLDALQAEWRQHPPVHHLVAAYLGYTAPAQASARFAPAPDIEDFARELGGAPVRQAAPIDTTAFDREMNHGRQ